MTEKQGYTDSDSGFEVKNCSILRGVGVGFEDNTKDKRQIKKTKTRQKKKAVRQKLILDSDSESKLVNFDANNQP